MTKAPEPDFGTPLISLGISGISSWLAWWTKVLLEAQDSAIPGLEGGQGWLV